MSYENIQNPASKKIKERSALKKSSISNTTLIRLQTSIQQAIDRRCPCRASSLAEEVLKSIQVNSQLTDYLGALEEEIQQITHQLGQLHRTYQFAEIMAQQHEYESIEEPSALLNRERDQKTSMLLSRLNQVLSVSRSYGSKELLRLNHSHPEEQEEQHSLRPPPLVFNHDF